MNRISKGFTLIELMIVVAIIAIFAAIIIPVITDDAGSSPNQGPQSSLSTTSPTTISSYCQTEKGKSDPNCG